MHGICGICAEAEQTAQDDHERASDPASVAAQPAQAQQEADQHRDHEHQAHGLSFSVLPDQEIPPSLQNIYQELHDDLGCYIPDNGYLEKWARQGVLMLNTVLTVRAHQANSHQNHGWEQFTDAILSAVNGQDRPIVYMLWGRPAQSKIPMLTNPKHLILKAPHPSPLSAYRGFFGCRHFSQANAFLESRGETPIDWQIENRR